MTQGRGIPPLRTAAAGLLLLALLLPAGAAEPTTELTPAPSARVPVAVRYPPVPIVGTSWAATVDKRAAADKQARLSPARQPHSATRKANKTDKTDKTNRAR